MRSLKPCPFCGCELTFGNVDYLGVQYDHPENDCFLARIGDVFSVYGDEYERWNRRATEIVAVETSFYDKEEIYEDCTVQVLTNTVTGETSVGWWKNNG